MTDWADRTNGFACFLVGIIADFSDQKVDDVGLTLFMLRFVLWLAVMVSWWRNPLAFGQAFLKGREEGTQPNFLLY